jgi:pilus assembly protein CpaD
MSNRNHRTAAAALVLALGTVGLAGCAGTAENRSLESVNQPVVQRTNYTFDVSTGPGGLSYSEQRRLSDWFGAMNLRYGDRIAIDDPSGSGATRAAVEDVASRYGLLLGDQAPVTPGYVSPGTARVVVTRTSATVPGCPDWKTRSDTNLSNATAHGFGCAVNGNLAAMVADPEHLIQGATGTGETVVMSSTKAIDSYREASPTGEKGLKQNATGGN